MKYWIIFFIIALSSHAVASSLSICENELTMNGPTKNLVSYFSKLLERHLIAETGMRALIEGIDRGSLVNPILEKDAATSSALLVHREKLEKLLKTPGIEAELLRDWILRTMNENARAKADREAANEQTRDPFEKAVFLPVPAGAYNGTFQSSGPPKLTNVLAFEVMRTHVTQKMWVEVMGENPSWFKTGLDSRTLNVNGKNVTMRPDNPVENITWWSALVFANRFSVKHGLKPVYDLSGLKFNGDIDTEAAKGTLVADAGELRIYVAPGGTVYETEGFRLPMEDEANYLLTDLGRHPDHFINFEKKLMGKTGPNLALLEQHAWFSQNSLSEGPEMGTHPVAQRLPYILETPNGPLELFDLQGNVDLWTVKMDYVTNEHPPARGVDTFQQIKGGSWIGDGYDLVASTKMPQATSNRVYSTGLRLVRSLPK